MRRTPFLHRINLHHVLKFRGYAYQSGAQHYSSTKTHQTPGAQARHHYRVSAHAKKTTTTTTFVVPGRDFKAVETTAAARPALDFLEIAYPRVGNHHSSSAASPASAGLSRNPPESMSNGNFCNPKNIYAPPVAKSTDYRVTSRHPLQHFHRKTCFALNL